MVVATHPVVGVCGADRDCRDPLLRLCRLMDRDSVVPLHGHDDSGVIAVRGRINGAAVFAYCTDATRIGGALGAAGSTHVVTAIDRAVTESCPVIGIWESGGARLAEGVESLEGVGRMFAAMTRASGKIPQISLVVGPAAGAAAYGPALTDVVIMSSAARIFVTGPHVVRSVTGEQIDMEALGGPDTHSRNSGVAHVVVESEAEVWERARRITTLLAQPGEFVLRTLQKIANPGSVLPDSIRRAYDVRPLIRRLLDGNEESTVLEELQPRWAPNMLIGLGRLAGRTIGVIANNPLRKGGCLDSLSAEKAARFTRMCDSFGIPLLVLVDVPGYLPGASEERAGVVRRGAKLLHAFAECVVPRVTLVTRKSYGGAYIAMNSRSLGATAVFAWPDAEVAVMDAEAAVAVLHRKRLAAAMEEDQEALRARLVDEHNRIAGGIKRAIAIGAIDEVIEPIDTRRRVAEALAGAPAIRGRHGNIPL